MKAFVKSICLRHVKRKHFWKHLFKACVKIKSKPFVRSIWLKHVVKAFAESMLKALLEAFLKAFVKSLLKAFVSSMLGAFVAFLDVYHFRQLVFCPSLAKKCNALWIQVNIQLRIEWLVDSLPFCMLVQIYGIHCHELCLIDNSVSFFSYH